jgi:hypothetical protein
MEGPEAPAELGAPHSSKSRAPGPVRAAAPVSGRARRELPCRLPARRLRLQPQASPHPLERPVIHTRPPPARHACPRVRAAAPVMS